MSRQVMLKERLCVCVREDDPLSVLSEVGLDQLNGRPLLLTQHGADIRTQVDEALRRAGLVPRPDLICDDARAIRKLILAREGISIVPEHSWGFADVPGLRLIPVRDPECSRTLLIYWNKNTALSPEAAAFLRLITDFCHENFLL